MRSYKLLSIVLLLGVGMLFVSMPASADIINYGADGLPGGTGANADTQLFYDSFEGLGTNVSHIAKPDTSGDFDPGTPPVGLSWNMTEATQEYGQVTNHVGVGDPGPAPGCGSNYLRMWRDTTIGGSVQPEAYFTEQSTTGDVIHTDVMVNITGHGTGTSYSGMSLHLFSANQSQRIVTFAAGASGAVQYYSPSTHLFTTIGSITWTEDQWQEWQIDYTIGGSSITLTIDDTSVTGNYAYTTGAVGCMILGAPYPDTDPTYFDDVVPEPSTLALLATGLIGLLAYAWRKRK